MRRRNRYIIRAIAGTGICLLVGAPWIRSFTVAARASALRPSSELASNRTGKDAQTSAAATSAQSATHSALAAKPASTVPKAALDGAQVKRLPGHVPLAPTARPQEPSVLATTATPDLHTAGLGQLVRSDAPDWLPGATMPALPRLLRGDGQHAIAAPQSPALASMLSQMPADLPEPIRLGGALVAPSPPTDLAKLFVPAPRPSPDLWDDTARDPAKAQSFRAAATIVATLRATPALPLQQLIVPLPEDRDPAVQSRRIIPESDAPINLGEVPERRTIQPVR